MSQSDIDLKYATGQLFFFPWMVKKLGYTWSTLLIMYTILYVTVHHLYLFGQACNRNNNCHCHYHDITSAAKDVSLGSLRVVLSGNYKAERLIHLEDICMQKRHLYVLIFFSELINEALFHQVSITRDWSELGSPKSMWPLYVPWRLRKLCQWKLD